MPASGERFGLGGMAAVGCGRRTGDGGVLRGPLLLAGGALGAVGGILANGWLITVGPVILLAGTGYALQCRVRRRGAGPQDCCPTVPAPPAPQAGETPDRDDPR